MNYVLYGDEKLLLDKKLESLKKKYKISEADMNMMVYWCNETAMGDIIEDALTPSFFSDYKMVVVKNPLFLTTQKQKDVSDEDVKILLDYLNHDNPSTIFVIYHDVKNFDERKKIVKTLRKICTFYEAAKLTSQQLYKTVRESIIARNCTIDDDALNLFLSRMSNDLLSISKEVEKLCLYTNHIDKAAVDKLVVKQTEENVFELTSAYLNKDLEKTFKIYKDLMIKNEEPIKLIVLIGNSLRLLYQVRLLDRKGYNDKEIASMLSLNPFRLKYIRADGQDFELNELLDKIDQLSQLDIAIKTGKIDKYKGLELFILRMEAS